MRPDTNEDRKNHTNIYMCIIDEMQRMKEKRKIIKINTKLFLFHRTSTINQPTAIPPKCKLHKKNQKKKKTNSDKHAYKTHPWPSALTHSQSIYSEFIWLRCISSSLCMSHHHVATLTNWTKEEKTKEKKNKKTFQNLFISTLMKRLSFPFENSI